MIATIPGGARTTGTSATGAVVVLAVVVLAVVAAPAGSEGTVTHDTTIATSTIRRSDPGSAGMSERAMPGRPIPTAAAHAPAVTKSHTLATTATVQETNKASSSPRAQVVAPKWGWASKWGRATTSAASAAPATAATRLKGAAERVLEGAASDMTDS